MRKQSRIVGIVIALIGLASFARAKSVEEDFTLDFKPAQDSGDLVSFVLCYHGDGEKEIVDIRSNDVCAVFSGRWQATPVSNRVVVTGTGSFGTSVLKNGDCVFGQHPLTALFKSVSAGKNTVSLEMTVKVLSDKKTIKLRKAVDFELTPKQLEYFAAHQR